MRVHFSFRVFAKEFEYIRHRARDDRAMIQSRHYFDLALEIQRLELIRECLRTGWPYCRVRFALHVELDAFIVVRTPIREDHAVGMNMLINDHDTIRILKDLEWFR